MMLNTLHLELFVSKLKIIPGLIIYPLHTYPHPHKNLPSLFKLNLI